MSHGAGRIQAASQRRRRQWHGRRLSPTSGLLLVRWWLSPPPLVIKRLRLTSAGTSASPPPTPLPHLPAPSLPPSSVADWRRLPIKQDLKGDTNILHFLGNGVSPEGITILLIKLKGFFDGLRQDNAKFMCPFQITGVPLSYKRNNAVPFPQDMRYPPVESWFMVNA